MPKIDITKTELVWPGKYNEGGSLREVPRVNLPFQVIERVNESRATREAHKTTHPSLFDFYSGKEGDTIETGWRNKLIWGDNLLVMGSLLEKFAGKVDLIYIDPPPRSPPRLAPGGQTDAGVRPREFQTQRHQTIHLAAQPDGRPLGMHEDRFQLRRHLQRL